MASAGARVTSSKQHVRAAGARQGLRASKVIAPSECNDSPSESSRHRMSSGDRRSSPVHTGSCRPATREATERPWEAAREGHMCGNALQRFCSACRAWMPVLMAGMRGNTGGLTASSGSCAACRRRQQRGTIGGLPPGAPSHSLQAIGRKTTAPRARQRRIWALCSPPPVPFHAVS